MKHAFKISVFVLTLAVAAGAQAQIKLARSPGRAALTGAIVMAEICKQAGVELQTLAMPPNRASAEAAAGRIDGEVARTADYANGNPVLLRVEPAFGYVPLAAFWLASSGVELASAKDLQKYTVGRVLGMAAFDDLVAGHPNVQQAANRETLFKMLAARRFSVALDTLGSGDAELKRAGHTGVTRVELQRRNLYLYLHVKHKDLAAKLGGIIKKLADSGQLAKMLALAEQQADSSGLEP